MLMKLHQTSGHKAGRGWRRGKFTGLTGINPKAPACLPHRRPSRPKHHRLVRKAGRGHRAPWGPSNQTLTRQESDNARGDNLWGPACAALGDSACGSPNLHSVWLSVTYFLFYPGIKGISVFDLLDEENRKWNEICSKDYSLFHFENYGRKEEKYSGKLHMSSVFNSRSLPWAQ